MKNRYSVYIPSRGRFDNCLTADLLIKDGIDFKIFVEDIEYDKYVEKYGIDKIVNLGGNNFGGVQFARNFIKEYSKNLGEKRHWQIDDDIKKFSRLENNKKMFS